MLKTATGVWLGEERVVVTSVAKTPLGMRQLGTLDVPIDGGDLAGTLADLLQRGRLKGKVVCGLDARRSFTITRRVGPEEEGSSPVELLSARLGYVEGGLAAGMSSIKLPSGPHRLLAACPGRLAQHVMVGLAGLRPSQVRLAPVTPVLLKLAQRMHKSPRRWRTEVRVLLGESVGMAVLVYAGRPVASRLFDTEPRDLSQAVETAVLSLMTHAREPLGLGPVDGLILHIDEERYPDLADSVGTECDVHTVVGPAMSVDGESASHALAVAGLTDKSSAIDLLRDLHPPAGLRKNFPTPAAVLLTVILAGSWAMIHRQAAVLNHSAERFEQKARSLARSAMVGVDDLEQEHERFSVEVSNASAFLANRVFWSDLLRELPDVLPEPVELVDFEGRDKANFPTKKKGAESTKGRQLNLTTMVPMDEETVSPPEVAQINERLRASEAYQESFPRITGANVRITPGKKGVFASIRILLLPGSR